MVFFVLGMANRGFLQWRIDREFGRGSHGAILRFWLITWAIFLSVYGLMARFDQVVYVSIGPFYRSPCLPYIPRWAWDTNREFSLGFGGSGSIAWVALGIIDRRPNRTYQDQDRSDQDRSFRSLVQSRVHTT